MENIVLDPSKSEYTNIIYKGPVDTINQGRPLLSKGFLNMRCKNKKDLKNVNKVFLKFIPKNFILQILKLSSNNPNENLQKLKYTFILKFINLIFNHGTIIMMIMRTWRN